MSGILLGIVGATFSSPPVNTVAPAVTGSASVGETLTSSTGTWTGAGITYSYQWQHTTTNISGATSSTYVIEVAYVGETIRCVVTATNSAGTSSANSNATSAVAAAAAYNLWAWGNNSYGQLGLGDTNMRSSPIQVGALGTWSQVGGARRGSFTHAVDTNGKLWTWGQNSNGQLGLGDTAHRSSPVQVGALTNWSNSLMPIGGTTGAVMVKSNGTLWVVGIANFILSNEVINFSSPTQASSDKTWAFSTFNNTNESWFGITTGGQLWSSAHVNTNGISGQGNTTNTNSPAQVGALTDWAGVYGGTKGIIARKTNGTLWSWGKAYPTNAKAFLGQNGDFYAVSSPVQIGILTNWAKVSTSGDYIAGAVKTDGTLWTWGRGENGMLGLGDTANRSSPTIVGSLTTLTTTDDKFSMAAGVSLAIKSGELWSWGRGYFGAQGKNDTILRSSPTQVGSLTTWTKVTNNYNSTLAIANH